MKSLTYLSLYSNRLTGELPFALWGLDNLMSLKLNDNRLSGTISPRVGGMIALTFLSIFSNSLSGPIPEEMWGLSRMGSLELYENMLVGTLPQAVGGMASLTYLSIFANKLSGKIPEEIWRLTQMASLLLYCNSFSGTLSSLIGGMASLTYLGIYTNSLSGKIPDELWKLSNLYSLELYDNHLSGTISPSIAALTLLVSLRLEDNELYGSLPSKLAHLLMLRYLSLSGNRFVGTIPSELARMSSVQEIQLGRNLLSGTISAGLGDLLHLQRIDLFSNRLSGSVPASFGRLAALQVLRLSRNRLMGSIPFELCRLSRTLEIVDLSANSFWGRVPVCLSDLGVLQTLLLAKNQFTSSSIGSSDLVFLLAPNLTTIDISSNVFRGALPTAIFLSTTLKTFAAASNCFHGSLPDSICYATSLQVLVLDGLSAGKSCQEPLWGAEDSTIFRLTGFRSKYKMEGTIPECLFAFPNMKTLHLSGNRFAGRIPSQLSAWPAVLEDLTLSHNQLTGPIPNALQLLVKQFSNFDLSFNKLDGLLEGLTVSNSTMVNLNVNRFSGFLSSDVVTAPAGHIRVLEGSLIDCEDRKTQLPSSDPYIERFKCGSDTFNSYLIAFAALLFSIGILLHRSGTSFAGIAAFVNPNVPPVDPSIQQFLLSLRHVRLYCAIVFGVIVLIMLPTYCSLSLFEGSYTFLYAWTASAAFKSGTTSAAVLLIFWTCFLLGNIWLFTVSQMAHKSGARDNSKNSSGAHVQSNVGISIKSERVVRMLLLLRLLLIFSINVVAMLAPNFGYVVVFSLYTSSAQAAASFFLTVYKLFWTTLVSPRVLKLKLLYLGVLRDDIDAHGLASLRGGMVFDLLLSAFSSVMAPSIALMAANRNCFLAALWTPTSIVSSYRTDICGYGLTYFSLTIRDVTTNTEKLFKMCTTVTVDQSYQPPFEYNYQCSSTLLQTYSPVFLLMALYSAFGEPLLHFVCRACVSSFPSNSWMLLRLLPRIMHTRQEREAADKRILDKNGQLLLIEKTFRIVDRKAVFRAMMQDVMLLLTFGTVAPLLGLTFLASLTSRSLRWHHLICEFVLDEEEIAGGGVSDLTADIRDLSRSLSSGTTISSAGLFIVIFASLFLSFFLIDTGGDRVGLRGAEWAPILMWTLPVGFGMLMRRALWRSQPVDSHPYIDEIIVEMSSAAHLNVADRQKQWSSNPIHNDRTRSLDGGLTASISDRGIIDIVPDHISTSASLSLPGSRGSSHQDGLAAAIGISAHDILQRPDFFKSSSARL